MKLWGGRFSKEPDKEFMAFSSSIELDSFLWREELLQNAAYAHGLKKAGIFSEEEFEKIIDSLRTLYLEASSGKIFWQKNDEDIHSAVERSLYELIGDTAYKVHTGRSRNEQISTDLRLYFKRKIVEINSEIVRILEIILELAKKYENDFLPAYTHLQHAQPVRLAHYFLSWFFMLKRDFDRLVSCQKKLNFCPLGSGAATGNSFNIDRQLLSDLLGFKRPMDNSIDAVSDRDFILHFLSQIANLSIHLSRFAEELVLWSSKEFGFVVLDEAYSTGSSLMPQKRNPDSLELIRAFAGRILGAWVQVATVLKGLPLSYNRDLQEDRAYAVCVAENITEVLKIFGRVLATASFNTEKMKEALKDDFIYATDVADYLVRKGVPFRKAHEIVGKLVKLAEGEGAGLSQLSLEKIREVSELFEADYYDIFEPSKSCDMKVSYGGTALSSVRAQIDEAESIIRSHKDWVSRMESELKEIFRKIFGI